MKKFIVLSIVLLMIAGFAITSSAHGTLMAGQNIEVGYLHVEVDGDNLVVTYTITAPCWVLGDTHLYIGKVAPKKSAPGQFPYGPEDAVNGGVYIIPLTDLNAVPGVQLYIAAHAEVTNTCEPREETAWVVGCEIRPGKNWAMYFGFVVPVPE